MAVLSSPRQSHVLQNGIILDGRVLYIVYLSLGVVQAYEEELKKGKRFHDRCCKRTL
jgi:hypothetical protein